MSGQEMPASTQPPVARQTFRNPAPTPTRPSRRAGSSRTYGGWVLFFVLTPFSAHWIWNASFASSTWICLLCSPCGPHHDRVGTGTSATLHVHTACHSVQQKPSPVTYQVLADRQSLECCFMACVYDPVFFLHLCQCLVMQISYSLGAGSHAFLNLNVLPEGASVWFRTFCVVAFIRLEGRLSKFM